MDAALTDPRAPVLELGPNRSFFARQRAAARDLAEAARLWRLVLRLGWLDIRLRYRGSILGPFWLTLSTAVMVFALGFLYSTLLHTDVHTFLPFLALSLVLWSSGIAAIITDACTCFLDAESAIRSMRMPFALYPARIVVRNLIALAHNVVVIVAVFAWYQFWPGWHAVYALPALLVWVVDGLAAGLLLGAFCARFRDIPPIVGSIMQIAFFLSAIIWQPEQVGRAARFLPLNPFFSILDIARAPLLGGTAPTMVWVSALAYSFVLCVLAWLLFARVRGRLAFWV
jgi:lipopolysaccharide transport system permease protein